MKKQPTPSPQRRESTGCPCCGENGAGAPLRRPSGSKCILGLLAGAFLIPASVLGILHWDESRQDHGAASRALWDAMKEAGLSSGSATGSLAPGMSAAGQPGRVFSPPPGWDDGLLSQHDSPREVEGSHTTTLDTLLHFLHQLGAGESWMPPTPTPLRDEASPARIPFQQAAALKLDP
jgi:hypothetical protein